MHSPVPQPPPSKVDAGDSMLGRVLDGRYRIESELGEGGLGCVYRAHHLKLARPVAVKVLKSELRGVPEIRKRFEREVRALSSLSHPNIVTITDYGVADGLPYLVMELAEGVELNKIDKEELDPERAIEIVRQVLGTLTYAHAHDVIHRDLKPANVIVRTLPDGRHHATVLDFGLAKFVGDGESSAADLTRSGLVVGTPAYMPPEHLASGARRADARADLYAAGLILFELVAGRRPFLHEESTDLLRAHLLEAPPTLAEVMPTAKVSPELEAVVAKALAKTPADRWQSATEMIAALDALPRVPVLTEKRARASAPGLRALRGGATELDGESLAQHLAQRRRDRRQRVVAGTALAALAAAILLLALGYGSTPAFLRGMAGDLTLPAPLAEAAASPPQVASASPSESPVEVERFDEMMPPPPEPTPPVVDSMLAVDALPDTPPPMIEVEPVDPELAELDAEDPDPGTGDDESAEPAADALVERPASRNPWRGSIPSALRRLLPRVQRGRELSRYELRVLTRYRNEHPRDARARLLLGHAFATRGWLTAALIQYQRACAIDLGVRGDPMLLENLVLMARTETLGVTASDAIVRVYGNEAATEVHRLLGRSSGDDAERLRALLGRIES